MTNWVLFLRGVNVGGHNKLPMAKLRSLLRELGYSQVKTYIQSGNAVFTSDATKGIIAQDIANTIEAECGFRPSALVLSLPALQNAITKNPFARAEADPKSLHLFFLMGPVDMDGAVLESVRLPSERVQKIGDVIYLYAPEGIGRSKLAERVPRSVDVDVTARNWRTVKQMADL